MLDEMGARKYPKIRKKFFLSEIAMSILTCWHGCAITEDCAVPRNSKGPLRYDQSTLVMCMYGPGQVFEAIEYVSQFGYRRSPLSGRNERHAILGNNTFALPAFHGGREFWDFLSATRHIGVYAGNFESRVIFTCRARSPCVKVGSANRRRYALTVIPILLFLEKLLGNTLFLVCL